MIGILTNWLSREKLEAVQGLLYLPCGPYLAKLYKSLGFYFYEMLHSTFFLKALKDPSRGLARHTHADFVVPLARII